MKHIAISVLGKDRPGIVACITKVLYEYGCNLEDTSMTQLRHEFAMILLVALPEKLKLSLLEQKLKKAAASMKLSVLVRPMSEKEDLVVKSKKAQFVIAVYGADKPGIVYKITKLLSDNYVNITDVQTNITGSADKKNYVMLLEATLPSETSPKKLKTLLSKTASALKVTIALNPVDTPSL